MANRIAEVTRKTAETDITLKLDVDGTGLVTVATGVGFLDHMLHLMARHALMDLTVTAAGDRHVDDHHTSEDVGICLGQAIAKALGDKKGIRRFSHFVVPMDEAMAQVTLDLSGRTSFVYNVDYRSDKIGTFDVELVEEFLNALSANARMNLHVNVPYGTNGHHIAEAVFKAAGKALRFAMEIDPRETSVPSTKGTL